MFDRRGISAGLALACGILLLAACTPAPAEPNAATTPPPATPTSTESPEVTETSAAPEETVEAPPADPTCETIIPAADVAAFAAQGWTFRESPLQIEGTDFSAGLSCMWGNYDGPGSDNVMIYGWAPMTPEQAEVARNALVSLGWEEDHGAMVVYVTLPNPLTVDSDGYGDTYGFYDGYVVYGITRSAMWSVIVPGE